MKKILLLLLCALIFSAYSVEERVGTDVLSSYEVTDLLQIQKPKDRVIYVDGEFFAHSDWSDFEVQFEKLNRAFALVVLDEINNLRVNAALSERTVTQLKTAVRDKYETL